MARCIREDCEAEAIPPSNYCFNHRPKQKFITRIEKPLDDLASDSDVLFREKVPLREDERRRRRLYISVQALITKLPDDERRILQLRFVKGMTVAQIARALDLDQKRIYRHIDRRIRDITEELVRAGFDVTDVRDLFDRGEWSDDSAYDGQDDYKSDKKDER